MALDRLDMALRGRIGGYAKAAKYPADQLTLSARSGFLKRFRPTDPDLSEPERERRTECALKAYMAGLTRKSALARRKNKENQDGWKKKLAVCPSQPGSD